ncbi:MAG: hypothetical protein ACRDQZ_23860, partial [Mycobacteriales bacterium]
GSAAVPVAELGEQRKVVDAFLSASWDGDLDMLLAVLDRTWCFARTGSCCRHKHRAKCTVQRPSPISSPVVPGSAARRSWAVSWESW